MKTFKAKQTKIIVGNNAEDFEAKLNKALKDLTTKDTTYELSFNTNMGFCAYIVYTAEHDIAETIEDEYTLLGERHKCGECQYFELPSDKRVKYVHCQHHRRLVGQDSCACEEFYESLSQAKKFLKENNDESSSSH